MNGIRKSGFMNNTWEKVNSFIISHIEWHVSLYATVSCKTITIDDIISSVDIMSVYCP